MSIAQLVLEYLKVLLSTPVVVGCVLLTVVFFFRTQFGRLIDRVASIKLAGGEVSTPQLPPDTSQIAPADLPKSELDQPALPPAPSPEDVSRFQEILRAERMRSHMWEYRYLNLFLVPMTVQVLQWFAGTTSRPTDSTYDTYWASAIPDVNQRRVILSVLESHHLVQRDGDLLGVSEKGREYLEWKDKV